MPQKLTFPIVLAVFLGGGLGALSRYGIELLIPINNQQLILTAIVNLLGAFALGVVNTHPLFEKELSKHFVGPGFLGSFTTMSALAAIAAGPGLSDAGYWYWLFVVGQMVLGVLVYFAGSKAVKS